MSAHDVKVRGYAAPFNQLARVDGGVERFAAQAFDLSTGREVDLRVMHEGRPFARSGDGTLVLFQDEFGLAYEAALPDLALLDGLWHLMRKGELGASVNFSAHPRDKAVMTHAVGRETVITACTIDHIAITPSPYYGATSCWLSTWEADLDAWPTHLRADARRWTRSFGRLAEGPRGRETSRPPAGNAALRPKASTRLLAKVDAVLKEAAVAHPMRARSSSKGF